MHLPTQVDGPSFLSGLHSSRYTAITCTNKATVNPPPPSFPRDHFVGEHSKNTQFLLIPNLVSGLWEHKKDGHHRAKDMDLSSQTSPSNRKRYPYHGCSSSDMKSRSVYMGPIKPPLHCTSSGDHRQPMQSKCYANSCGAVLFMNNDGDVSYLCHSSSPIFG